MKTAFINASGQMRSGWRIALMLALTAAAIASINTGWRAAGLPGMRAGGGWWFLVFATLVGGSMLAIVVTLLRFLERAGPDAIGLPFRSGALRQTAAGTLLGGVPILLIVGAAIAFGYGRIEPAGITMTGVATTMLPLVIAGFLLAAWEELLLRGYLLRQFTLGLNPPAAVIITGVLFGVMHAGNPGANWEGLVYTAVGGILMGWLMIRSGSLWLLIGYHFGWNAVSSAVFGLELSGFETDASTLTMTLAGSDWLTGGQYGFEASVPAVIAEVVTLSVALRLLGSDRRASFA